MSTQVSYPKAQFSIEPYRYQNPIHTGGYNNHHPLIGQKIVFPGFVPVENVLTYRVQLATVFQGTVCESDFCSSTRPNVTLRGVGASNKATATGDSSLLHDGIEIVFDSLSGIGGIPAVLRKLYNNVYKKILHSNIINGYLHIGDINYGTMNTEVAVLPSTTYLQRNGFLGSAPEHSSMVLLVNIHIIFTAKQVEMILGNSNNISRKYDKTQRIVMRVDSDESDLIATARNPAACVCWHFTQWQDDCVLEQMGTAQHTIERVQYTQDKS